MEIVITADVTRWGSFVTYRERCEQNNSIQSFVRGRNDTNGGRNSRSLLLTRPRQYTPSSCGKKTNHLSEETTRHRHHMVEILIRGWRRAHPPVRWGISCSTWATNWRRNLSQVCIFFVYQRKVQLPQTCYAIMWSNQKCWWLRGPPPHPPTPMRWLSALNASAPGFSG